MTDQAQTLTPPQARLTVTEALAAIKTIEKRVTKKREFIMRHLVRQERFKDPLEAEGGQSKAIDAAVHAISDLSNHRMALRMAIAAANVKKLVTVNGLTLSIAQWLIWRRELAPLEQQFFKQVDQNIEGVRKEALRQGFTVSEQASTRPDDIVVNISELRSAEAAENLEITLGELDGKLSIANATTHI